MPSTWNGGALSPAQRADARSFLGMEAGGLWGPGGNVGRRFPGVLSSLQTLYDNSGNGTIGGSVRTYCLKFEAPGAFTGVRIWIASRAAGSTPNWRMIVAPTETFANDTDTNRYVPIIGGTARPNMETGTVPGWVPVTWSGSNTAAVETSDGTDQLLYWQASDIIPLRSVDTGAGSFLMLRANAASSGVGTVLFAKSSDFNASYPKQRRAFNFIYADVVSNPASNAPSGDQFNADSLPFFFVEFFTQENQGTALILGDSVSVRSGTVNLANTYESWTSRALTRAFPKCGVVNLAKGGSNWENWKNQFDRYIAKDVNRSLRYIFFPSQSFNSQNQQYVRQHSGIQEYILNICAERNITPFIWTIYPATQNAATQPAANAWARAAAAAGRCVLIDLAQYLSQYPIASYTDDGSYLHPNLTGCQYMENETVRLMNLWQAGH